MVSTKVSLLTSTATLQMVNRAGRPAFASETALTANAGSFAVETGNDFDSDSSFVMGYGTVDEEGRLKPLVTVREALPGYPMTQPLTVSRWMLRPMQP